MDSARRNHSRIVEIDFGLGSFMFNGHQKRPPTPEPAHACVIPHLDLFVKPCHHMSPYVKG